MTVYLALGSNHGARARHIAAALAALPAAGLRVKRVSRWRETAPVQATGRARFLNAVAEAETQLLPRVLLRRLHQVERGCGRRRHPEGPRNTPRSCDLDLIFYGRSRIAAPGLRVPHPRFAQRLFVLDGLVELAPELHPPGSAVSMRRARARLLEAAWRRPLAPKPRAKVGEPRC